VYQRMTHPRFQVQPLNTQEVARRIAQAFPGRSKAVSKYLLKRSWRTRGRPIAADPSFVQPVLGTGDANREAEVVLQKPWLNLYRFGTNTS